MSRRWCRDYRRQIDDHDAPVATLPFDADRAVLAASKLLDRPLESTGDHAARIGQFVVRGPALAGIPIGPPSYRPQGQLLLWGQVAVAQFVRVDLHEGTTALAVRGIHLISHGGHSSERK